MTPTGHGRKSKAQFDDRPSRPDRRLDPGDAIVDRGAVAPRLAQLHPRTASVAANDGRVRTKAEEVSLAACSSRAGAKASKYAQRFARIDAVGVNSSGMTRAYCSKAACNSALSSSNSTGCGNLDGV